VRYVCHGRWYQLRPATVYWYQPLVPETSQCDICLSEVKDKESNDLRIRGVDKLLHFIEGVVKVNSCDEVGR